MAAKRTRKPAPASPTPPRPPDGPTPNWQADGNYTGRCIVIFREKETRDGIRQVQSVSGVRGVARASDFEAGAMEMAEVGATDLRVFDKLGMAILAGDPSQISAVTAASADEGAIKMVVREQFVYALEGDDTITIPPLPPPPIQPGPAPLPFGGTSGFSLEYLRGYRDAVNTLYAALSGTAQAAGLALGGPELGLEAFRDTTQATWGLQATKAAESRYTGAGVRVAVLDTGFDVNHPDFTGRVIQPRSFVEGESVQDVNGHGTHCIGTACGPRSPSGLPRYGVATRAEIFAGKVLSNAGVGLDGSILAGIEWAITNGCKVISMSLGAQVFGAPPDELYDSVGKRSLQAGCLIVAAAGNDSNRQWGDIKAVSRPANSRYIMAVAALDSRLAVANFSNGTKNKDGGQIDVAAPGVAILSAAPMPRRSATMDGTSMATPHVAGLAALLSEANDNAGGVELWQLLAAHARRLPVPVTDVGFGLAQAP